jgi:inosine/xanthosine triphosphate pyrophosphatase family protein
MQDMHDKEKEILENEAKSKIEHRRAALEKYQQVKSQ